MTQFLIGLQLQGDIPERAHYHYTPVRGCNGNVSKMRHQVIYIVECWLCCSLLYLIRVYHHTRSDQILGTILYAFEKYHLKLNECPKLLLGTLIDGECCMYYILDRNCPTEKLRNLCQLFIDRFGIVCSVIL